VFFPLVDRATPASVAAHSTKPPTERCECAPASSNLFLAPGTCSLLASFGTRGTSWLPRIELERGRVTDVGTLVCGFGALRGRVLDESGEPAGGAEIVLSSPYAPVLQAFSPRRALTSEDGRFEVQSLPAGPWIASARRGGSVGSSTVADVFPGESAELDIALLSGARLTVVRRGTVSWPRGTDGRTPRPESPEPATSASGRRLRSVRRRVDPVVGRSAVRAPIRSDRGSAPSSSRSAGIRALPTTNRTFRCGGVDAVAWSLAPESLGATSRSTDHGADWFELDLEPGRYLVSARTCTAHESRQYTACVDVAPDEHELDFTPARLALTLRVGTGSRDARPPSASLLSVDGIPVQGWGVPMAFAPCEAGWRCNSVPANARLLLGGALPGKGNVEREVVTPREGELVVDWP
jgi:hypothetical protein